MNIDFFVPENLRKELLKNHKFIYDDRLVEKMLYYGFCCQICNCTIGISKTDNSLHFYDKRHYQLYYSFINNKYNDIFKLEYLSCEENIIKNIIE